MSNGTITRYRTKVIEDFIMIEGYVNAIICKHYLGQVRKTFMLEVLFDELCSSGLKANILEKVFQKYPSITHPREHADTFRRMSRIRNYFAHCNSTYSKNSPEGIVGGIPDPRHPNEYLDVDKELRTFTEHVTRMSETLLNLMDDMGIFYVQDTDKGMVSVLCEDSIGKDALPDRPSQDANANQ